MSNKVGGERPLKQLKAEITDTDNLDIGRFVNTKAVLDDDTKTTLINNHWKPPSAFNFPLSQFGSARRKFNACWLDRWSWLCYSKLYDGPFCLSCVLFGCETGHNGSKLTKLFKEPLTNWQNTATKLEEHEKHSLIHRDAMLSLVHFRSVMTGENINIDEQADNMRSERIQHNRDILSSITKTVILAGKQNFALRGHRDDSQHYTSANPGNFQALLDFRGHKATGNISKLRKKNATYRSKMIQNKLIEIVRNQIQEKIVSEIK